MNVVSSFLCQLLLHIFRFYAHNIFGILIFNARKTQKITLHIEITSGESVQCVMRSFNGISNAMSVCEIFSPLNLFALINAATYNIAEADTTVMLNHQQFFFSRL